MKSYATFTKHDFFVKSYLPRLSIRNMVVLKYLCIKPKLQCENFFNSCMKTHQNNLNGIISNKMESLINSHIGNLCVV